MTADQKSHFDANPHVQELHFCSDGTPFYTANNARGHAQGLADKTVTTIKRHSGESVDASEPDAEAQLADQKIKEGFENAAKEAEKATTAAAADPLLTEADANALAATQAAETPKTKGGRGKKA